DSAFAGPAGQGRSTRGSGVCLRLARRRPTGPGSATRTHSAGGAASLLPPRKSDAYAYFGPPPFRVTPRYASHGRERKIISGAELDSTVWTKGRRAAARGTRLYGPGDTG